MRSFLCVLSTILVSMIPAGAEVSTPSEVGNTNLVEIAFEFVEIVVSDPLPEILIELLGDAAAASNAPPAGIIPVGGTVDRDGITGQPVLGPYYKHLTQSEKAMLLEELHQGARADHLSAPRVLTRSGQEATIEVAQAHAYATTLETIAVSEMNAQAADTNNWQVVGQNAVRPAGYTNRTSGVSCTIRPSIAADNYTLELDLYATVTELPEWIEQDVSYRGVDGEERFFPLSQPTFNVRGVKGSFILWDQHSIVCFAGMYDEEAEIVDKIAILGDIPILGRLFTKRSTRHETRVLLIFVTPTIKKA